MGCHLGASTLLPYLPCLFPSLSLLLFLRSPFLLVLLSPLLSLFHHLLLAGYWLVLSPSGEAQGELGLVCLGL